MTAAQMLAHCSVSMQWRWEKWRPNPGAACTYDGAVLKPMVFRNEDPMRKNSPTAKGLIVADERDLGKKRKRLSGPIDKFAGFARNALDRIGVGVPRRLEGSRQNASIYELGMSN